MQNPNVTVIIAHYNYQKFLPYAIKSVLDQDYNNTTVCIIDDKSTDQESVKKICRDILGELKYIVDNVFYYEKGVLILSSENKGPSETRNIGIRYCSKSDFFMILDADDIMLPNKISELIKPMLTWDSIGVTYGDYYIRNEYGLIRQENKHPYSLRFLKNECIIHSGALVRAKALFDVQQNGEFYNSKFRVCEDYQLWLRIAQKYMVYHVPKLLTIVNDHSNNSTNTVSRQEWINHWNMLNSSIKG